MEQLKESEIADFAMKMNIHPEARDQIWTLPQSFSAKFPNNTVKCENKDFSDQLTTVIDHY